MVFIAFFPAGNTSEAMYQLAIKKLMRQDAMHTLSIFSGQQHFGSHVPAGCKELDEAGGNVVFVAFILANNISDSI